MNDPTVGMSLAPIEAAQLRRLVEDFRELIDTEPDLNDPAVARLTPDPYPEDADAGQEFQRSTRADLIDRRLADAEIVLGALGELGSNLEQMADETAFATVELRIAGTAVDPWLRTLTALRLVIATRMGIASDDDQDPDDPRSGVYDWLGYRLELLIESADDAGV